MKNNRLYGIVLLVIGVFLFAVFDASSKYLSQFFPVQFLVWARNSVNLLIVLAFLPSMGRELVTTPRPVLMAVRGALLVVTTLLLILAFRTLPLAETSAITFLAPLIVVILAGPLLGEKMSLRNWLAALGGFVGVLLIARPSGAVGGIGVVYAIGAALCNAFYQILTRKLSDTEPPMRQLFYGALVGTAMTTILVPQYWPEQVPTVMQALLLLSLGFTGGGGHLLLIRAFRETPASTLSPFLYLQLIWSVLMGWLVFDHVPDLISMSGMLVIGLSGMSLLLFRWRR
ncbi:DMT family transporter [Propionivibrio limicola]|uniref:DMT family transporter n=1 Tax=Propionivibrio limicola TaxID=167645 RepID=UPI00129216E0|nr:DMT family transporter [Propionivibrio limicola]